MLQESLQVRFRQTMAYFRRLPTFPRGRHTIGHRNLLEGRTHAIAGKKFLAGGADLQQIKFWLIWNFSPRKTRINRLD